MPYFCCSKMSEFYFTDDEINASINNPFYGAQNLDEYLEKEEQKRMKAVEQKHNEAVENNNNLKMIKKKNTSLKRKLPQLGTVISPDSSFVIRKNKGNAHHIIKIEILEIDNEDLGNSAKTNISVQYVVSENYDNMMDATENLINKIIKKLSGSEYV